MRKLMNKNSISSMKIIFIFMICIIILSSMRSIASNIEDESVRTIKVGYTADNGTFQIPAISGYEGYGYEYMQKIFTQMGDEYEAEFVECEWGTIRNELKKGTIDVFGPCFGFSKVDDEFTQTSMSVGNAYMFISTQEHSDDYADDYSHLDGCTIGIYENDANVDILKDFIDMTGISMEIVYLSEENYTNTNLISKVDYFITYSFNHVTNYEIVAQIGAIPLYYIADKNQQAFIDLLDETIRTIIYKEYLYQEKLYLKYYDYNITASNYVSEEELKKLQDYGTYTVAVQNLYSPFAQTNEDGHLSGVAIDFLQMIEEAAGIEVEVVEVDAGVVDIENYDFSLLLQGYDEKSIKSNPYLEIPILLLEHNVNVDNRVVGTLSYYGIGEEYLTEYLDGETIATYTNVKEMQEDFDEGIIKAMLITTSSLNFIANDLKEKNYFTTPVDFRLDLTINFPDDFSKSNIEIFNKVIANLDDTQLQYSLLQNSATVDTLTVFEFYQQNPWMVIFIFLIFGLMISIMSIRKSLEERRRNEYDELTQLYTERKFHDEVHKRLENNPHKQYLLVSIDIDNFKYINEMYGYETGTEVLKMLANHMKNQIGEGTIIARTFADNYFVLVEKKDYDKQISSHVNSNSLVLQELTKYLGDEYRLTFSVGVYEIYDKSLELNLMMDCTNIARQQGKGISDTTIDYYDDEINNRRMINNDIITNMEQGVVGNEFIVYYQPKVDLRTGKLHGAEALVRWNKNGVFTPPNHFIPLFEKNGFIRVLDYYVFEAVCKFIASNTFETVPKISVNISGVTIVETDVVARLLGILEKYELDASCFDIELTETAFVERFEAVINTVHALHSEGFTVSMDDFGAGISSLNRLKNIDIDTIKIDRELLEGHMEDDKGIVILKGILDMSNGLGLDIVAEGVETREQMQFLQAHKCYIGQGYYFSRPVTAEQFKEICYLNKFDIS